MCPRRLQTCRGETRARARDVPDLLRRNAVSLLCGQDARPAERSAWDWIITEPVTLKTPPVDAPQDAPGTLRQADACAAAMLARAAPLLLAARLPLRDRPPVPRDRKTIQPIRTARRCARTVPAGPPC